jgi:hypothetical protein
MLGARIPLDTIIDIAGFQVSIQCVNGFFRCVVIDLGAGEIHLAFDLVRAQMGRVIALRHEVGAINRGCALNAIGELGCRGEDEGTAHTITHCANFGDVSVGVGLKEIEQRLGVFHDELDPQVACHLHHALHARIVPLKDKFPGLAVIKVGQYYVVADGGDSAGHIVQFLTLARCIHIEHHDGKGAAFFGVGNEGIHRAVLGLDIDMLLYHAGLSMILVADANG